jgi:5'(3')-deoxyribonucleotidase
MARRLKVGIDMDGVVNDFVSAFREEAEILFDIKLPEFSTSWDFENWNLSKAQYNKLWNHVKNSEDWFYLKPNPFACVHEVLPWFESKHEPYFITTRMQTKGLPILKQTAMYLGDLGLQFPQVIVTKDKGLVAAALKLDAFVDDKIENLEDIALYAPECKVFLMTRTYNEDFVIPSRWSRVDSLSEFSDKIEELSNE